jgi:drug/metabolite transporter (DMT)-like permease
MWSIPSSRTKAAAHLAVAAAGVLFGTTFVVVQDAVRDVGPISFLAVRFLAGAAALAPFARRAPRQPRRAAAGLLCGATLLTGYLLQTIGLQYTSPSVSAFVTYLLVVIVPVIAAVVLRRPPSRPVVVGVALAAIGLFLLTGEATGLGLHKGELLTLGCALAFAVHILLLSELSPRFDTMALTATQLAVVGASCLVPGAFLGGYGFPLTVWLAALYTGVTVSAVAFALQVWGQRRVGPTRTSLLLMLEPVAAAALGYMTGDGLRPIAVAGAVLILAGVAVAETPLLEE